MHFNIFTLHPDIFQSFFSNSLIARGVSKDIISYNLVNWRENYGVGNYKQVDDKPFGGGSGMVLQVEPIVNAMLDKGCFEFAELETKKILENKVEVEQTVEFSRTLPPNAAFEIRKKQNPNIKKVNVLLTPRGFPLDQDIVQWLATDFDEVNLICGRYEGFDDRFSQFIDLEISMGNFVLNGGEVGAMCMIEAISRLVPDFVTKDGSVLHDSWSKGLNNYDEFKFANSHQQYTKKMQKLTNDKVADKPLFDNAKWQKEVLPHIEHPQYTRPNIWRGQSIPKVLTSGDHAQIQQWRKSWWK